MNLLLKNFSLFGLIFLLNCSFVFSQIHYAKVADPLLPEVAPLQSDLGLFIGLGGNYQSGKYLTQCDCDFTNGRGFGITIGALYERELFKIIRYGTAVYYDNKALKSNYLEIEDIEVFNSSGAFSEYIPIPFDNVSEATFHSLGIMPFIKLLPFNWAFLRVGFSADFIVSSNVTHTKELMKKTVLLSSGEIGIITLDDPRCIAGKCTLEDGDFPEVHSPYLTINSAIGLNIPFSAQVVLSPIFQFNIPFKEISRRGEDYKVNSWRIFLELRIALDDRKNTGSL